MAAMAEALRAMVRIFESGNVAEMISVTGPIAAAVLLGLILLDLLRSKRAAAEALKTVGTLHARLDSALRKIDQIEGKIERRLDARVEELDARMTKRLDSKSDMIQDRIDQRTADLSGSIGRLDARSSRLGEEMEQSRQRVREVEGRIPGLFDKIEEFRDMLAKTFQVELGSVLNSFDNSVGAVLQQMKSEMQLGISRIEGIESMVRSRKAAEKTLLGAPQQLEQPDAVEDEVEQKISEFQTWEAEAQQPDQSQPQEAEIHRPMFTRLEQALDVTDEADIDQELRHARDDEEVGEEMGPLSDDDVFIEEDDDEAAA